ncbi:hypothetical protein A2276_00945 [candidate division WOR-1 bacterium RIFOXYA12_FULL_43_27]|uniref:Uncharacterized protein n=1 Tax=candidate division WOR-1 bacterium RIFOXYC2_FULL_46_14 TaxID=1802587 RepID=A0A1F4U6K2_UNCSA|nr:MAG: hypothetical protein A2276_00945 [candidate division WOR-1 bacterium RIFOXYA12_FULL_43_27]OGC20747.1 MAG: hypothetical protein A2292_06930 [candidate division WOR-1 bacterium RIFOXYB2_FULL_46_45]OGC31516.1 MAG: hypothetical protein A2232_04520 [candidate division WOR-1 bacterium RIFOXYA2_FULL_46_56]OGC39923.1 MAG: hypothetical protein A2438_05360 [candidate division WOR-1 bacterium RIFOXYC2_FULL_46_14]
MQERTSKKGRPNCKCKKNNNFILEPKCSFPKTESRHRDKETRAYLAERNSIPYGIKTNSPFYRFSFCPNLINMFRSHETFWEMAAQASDLPRVKETRKIRLLYPGAGSHLAPLDLFHSLIQQDKIDYAKAIYTDIDPHQLDTIRDALAKLVRAKIYTDLKITPKNYPQGGFETTFSFYYQGKRIELVYALKMSGEDYYKEEYLAGADVLTIHDPFNKSKEPSYSLLKTYLKSLAKSTAENSPLIIMENLNDGGCFGDSKYFDPTVLPGTWTKNPHPYGHREEIMFEADYSLFTFGETGRHCFNSSLTYRPDLSLWKNFSPAEMHVLTSFLAKEEIDFFVEVDGKDVNLRDNKSAKEAAKFEKTFRSFFFVLHRATRRLEKINPAFAGNLALRTIHFYKKMQTLYPELMGRTKNYFDDRITFTRTSNKDLPLPPQVKELTVGRWSKLIYPYPLPEKGNPKLLESPMIFPNKQIGYTYYNLPLFEGLFDSKNNLVGLARIPERPNTEKSPEYLRLVNGRFVEAQSIDFIADFDIVKSGVFTIVLDDPQGKNIKGLIRR